MSIGLDNVLNNVSTGLSTGSSGLSSGLNAKKVAQLTSFLYLCTIISRIDVLPRAGNGMFPLRANRGTCHGTKQLKINNQKQNIMSKNKSKIVRWEYVTKPFDVYVFPEQVKRVHAPLEPSLSPHYGDGESYLHLRPCVQGVDEYDAVVKYLYCTRDGRFFVRGKDGCNEILPLNINRHSKNPAGGGGYDCPQLRRHGCKPAHRCVAVAWCNPPEEVIEQIRGDNFGVPNANQQSVCGGEEPRHTSPLCRRAASDATVLPKAWEVDHLNTDHKNWSADNLQWITADENRRRAKIARRMRQIGLDPKLLTPTLCKGIYTLPEERIEEFTGRFLMASNESVEPMDIWSIRTCVAIALDNVKSQISNDQ